MELKTARRIAQIEQKDLAEMARVDPSTISLLESGKRDYRTTAYEIIVRISRALHVEPTELFPIDTVDTEQVA